MDAYHILISYPASIIISLISHTNFRSTAKTDFENCLFFEGVGRVRNLINVLLIHLIFLFLKLPGFGENWKSSTDLSRWGFVCVCQW